MAMAAIWTSSAASGPEDVDAQHLAPVRLGDELHHRSASILVESVLIIGRKRVT